MEEDKTVRPLTETAGQEVREQGDGPERIPVPDTSEQLGNAASTSAGGGPMGVAPIAKDNTSTELDRRREE